MSPRTVPTIILDCDPGHDDADRHGGRRPPHQPARHHHGRRQRSARGDDAQRDRRARPARHRRAGARRRRAAARRRRRSTPATCTARAASTAPDLPEPVRPAGEPRRGRLHHRDVPQPRRRLAGADRTADQHRPRAALGARPRRPHRRHLADGWRHVRQPHGRRRVQHLGRPRGRRRSCSATAAR